MVWGEGFGFVVVVVVVVVGLLFFFCFVVVLAGGAVRECQDTCSYRQHRKATRTRDVWG